MTGDGVILSSRNNLRILVTSRLEGARKDSDGTCPDVPGCPQQLPHWHVRDDVCRTSCKSASLQLFGQVGIISKGSKKGVVSWTIGGEQLQWQCKPVPVILQEFTHVQPNHPESDCKRIFFFVWRLRRS